MHYTPYQQTLLRWRRLLGQHSPHLVVLICIDLTRRVLPDKPQQLLFRLHPHYTHAKSPLGVEHRPEDDHLPLVHIPPPVHRMLLHDTSFFRRHGLGKIGAARAQLDKEIFFIHK
jgi:hypothetical protein